MLNRWLGLPIFLVVMYLMFLFTQNLGAAFIDFFDILVGGVLVDGFGALLSSLGAPDWLRVMLANGIGGGIQTVSTFIPVVFFLFFFLAILEDSGYMARAAFVMDRLMRALGLPARPSCRFSSASAATCPPSWPPARWTAPPTASSRS